jgi:hypothetical protein
MPAAALTQPRQASYVRAMAGGQAVAVAPAHWDDGHRDEAVEPGRSSVDLGFVLWGSAAYLVFVAAGLAYGAVLDHGHVAYVVDDPAIHLSVARNLADHGTWGVVPGHFESASSSPLWTLLLAGWIKVLPGPISVAPLVLNIASCLGVIAVLGTNQTVLRPGRSRRWDIPAVAALCTVLLHLPGLTFTGMEHSLHIALVLAAVVLFHRHATGRAPTGWAGRSWLPYLLLALATATRYETLFVAVGLALWFATEPDGPGGPRSWPRRLRQPALILVASAAPVAAFGVFNRLMGGWFLPNSVLAKSRVETEKDSWLGQVASRITGDPLLAILVAALLVALIVVGHNRSAWSLPAVATCVAFALHVVFARVGWYDRYQAYLEALAIYALLAILADMLPALAGSVARPRLVPALLAVMLAFAGGRIMLNVRAPDGMNETYEQRYQVGEFLARYYDDQPIATGELGYVSLTHRGPITDIFGLGDYEVLREWSRDGGRPPARYWTRLADERGFDVVAIYPTTLFLDTPETWILVGTWDANQKVVTAPEDEFQFWATSPEAVAPLQDHLLDYEDDLPDGVTLELNDYAQLQADFAEADSDPSDSSSDNP